MANRRIHIVCTVAALAAARALHGQILGSDESQAFTVDLWEIGTTFDQAPTHKGLSGVYDEAQFEAVTATGNDGEPWWYGTCPDWPNANPSFTQYVNSIGLHERPDED